jgi:hypothetical protein
MVVRSIVGITIIFMLLGTVDAKNCLSSLKNVRDRIDNALQNGKTVSFKKLLAAEAGDAKGLLVQGHQVFKASTDGKQENINDAEQRLNNLFWSNQQELIEIIADRMPQSRDQAAQLLKNKIKERCSSCKAPLIAFAQELAREEQQLSEFFTSLLRLSEAKNTYVGDKESYVKRLKGMFDRHTTMTKSLQQLIGIANSLLVS